ncbi:DUF3761 domain-containing protein [uncultured Aeromicrobium sp.]|uniref:DUF3761 domain-containing protein n=1 Tax=uncultured Aeromicrobium sp. TaxID=337820 RepID=UPI0025F8F0AA|nr:G5 domain-containing protein [uncultured Aeromicrobium sp.]
MKTWFLDHSRVERAALSVVGALIVLGSVTVVAAGLASDPAPQPAEVSATPTPTPTPRETTPAPVITHETETVTEELPFETSAVEDPNLDVGDVRVVAAGAPGVLQRQTRVTYVDGKETKREPLPYVVARQPVTQIVAHGTRQPPPAPPPPPPAPAAPVSCPNGTYTNTDGNEVCRPHDSTGAPAGATAKCQDGTWSYSQNRRGTCSGHGGVAAWL